MESRGRALLRQAGVPEAVITVTRSADMRYLHQGFEINVPIPSGRLGPADRPRLQTNFDQAYERMYKRLNPDVEVEALNWRVIVAGPHPTIKMQPADQPTNSPAATRKGERLAYFPETSGFIGCPVYDRYQFTPGMGLRGPAIIEERESTVVVGPGARVEVDTSRNVVIWLPASQQC
jgi:N-methylhydantoinase A